MNTIFTSVATIQSAFVPGQTLYHYGAWNRFVPAATPDNPVYKPFWDFQQDTAVNVKAIRASLQGLEGPRRALGNPQWALRLSLGFSSQSFHERHLNIDIPVWGEWIDLDYLSYPSEAIGESRHLVAGIYQDPIPDFRDAYLFNSFNVQAAYAGQLICPVIECICEFAEALQGVNT